MLEPNYIEITSFTVVTSPDGSGHLIIGKGTDNWMYQFRGEDGVWARLSEKFPHTINLPGSETLNP